MTYVIYVFWQVPQEWKPELVCTTAAAAMAAMDKLRTDVPEAKVRIQRQGQHSWR
jgi:hypothetical protein